MITKPRTIFSDTIIGRPDSAEEGTPFRELSTGREYIYEHGWVELNQSKSAKSVEIPIVEECEACKIPDFETEETVESEIEEAPKPRQRRKKVEEQE